MPDPPEGDGRRTARWTAEHAGVLANERTGPDWHTLSLRAPRIAARALPGHFAQVRVTPLAAGSGAEPPADPLLRRPLSFCTIDPAQGVVSIIYRVVGRGTAALARARPGERLDLLGPLGCSFPDPGRAAARGRALVLAGGGLGIPPLACAAAWALAAGRRPLAVLGARSAAYLAGADEVARSGADVRTVTEDGSQGRSGLLTPALEEVLDAEPGAEVWACGPSAMLAAVQELCHDRGAACWLCVERPMACGFGVCLGCAIARADGRGYLRACADGPVFAADEVDVLG